MVWTPQISLKGPKGDTGATGPVNTSCMPKTGGAFSGGISFGSTAVSGVNLSRHIALHGTSYGLNVTSGTCNLVAGGHAFAFSSTGNLHGVSNLTATGTVSASSVTDTSDARLKTNIRRDKNRWRGLRKKIEMVLYDRIDGSHDDEPGVIAQEVQKVAPDFVGECVQKDGTKMLTVHYGKLALACALDPEGWK